MTGLHIGLSPKKLQEFAYQGAAAVRGRGGSGAVAKAMSGRRRWRICVAVAECLWWRRGIGSGAGAATNVDASLGLLGLVWLGLARVARLALLGLRQGRRLAMRACGHRRMLGGGGSGAWLA